MRHKVRMSPVFFVLLVVHLPGTDGLFGGKLDPGSPCHHCPPGYGVLRMCEQDALRDIACVECGSGTFNERYTQTNTCQPCTKCPAMFYAMRHCSRIKDTACLPCWNKNEGAAYGNEDYLQKCESQTKPKTTATLVIPPSTSRKVPTPSPGEEDRKANPPYKVPDIKVTTPMRGHIPKVTATGETRRTLGHERVTSPAMEITANETAPLVGETQTTSGSFQWQVLVAVLAGAAGVFLLGIIIAVCLTRDKDRDKEYTLRKDGKPVQEGLDEPDVKTKILDTSDLNAPERAVEDIAYDPRSPLCQAPLATRGPPSTGPKLLPRMGRQSISRDPRPPPPGPGSAGTGAEGMAPLGTGIPLNRPSPISGAPGVGATPPSPPGRNGVPQNTLLAGRPALHSDGQTPREDHRVEQVPFTGSPSEVASTPESSSPINGISPAKVNLQPETKDAPTNSNPRYSTPASTSGKEARRPVKRRRRPQRGQDSFSRNLHYIDEDSGDEVVAHTGRPPSEAYRDRWGRGLTRKVSEVLDRLRRGGSRRSSTASLQSPSRPPSQASFDLDDSRMTLDTTFDFHPDTTLNMTYDYLNTTTMSADFHNITGISELTIIDNNNKAGRTFEVYDTDL